ncbi:hypothetical protein FF38_03365 [Lucilia cuprina]|uniref:Uncharacterized protein n=1 Tax=Lucilia cuprina TaxID=7375 RepID=A0A0L0C8S6_LUCCU|nr:hypothetical protein FF38_03365 [Lucilia cuprina]
MNVTNTVAVEKAGKRKKQCSKLSANDLLYPWKETVFLAATLYLTLVRYLDLSLIISSHFAQQQAGSKTNTNNTTFNEWSGPVKTDNLSDFGYQIPDQNFSNYGVFRAYFEIPVFLILRVVADIVEKLERDDNLQTRDTSRNGLNWRRLAAGNIFQAAPPPSSFGSKAKPA